MITVEELWKGKERCEMGDGMGGDKRGQKSEAKPGLGRCQAKTCKKAWGNPLAPRLTCEKNAEYIVVIQTEDKYEERFLCTVHTKRQLRWDDKYSIKGELELTKKFRQELLTREEKKADEREAVRIRERQEERRRQMAPVLNERAGIRNIVVKELDRLEQGKYNGFDAQLPGQTELAEKLRRAILDAIDGRIQ